MNGADFYNRKTSLDLGTLSMLRKKYYPGVKVEAIKVRNVPTGSRGVVREVFDSGEISVLWANGEVYDVEFGNDSVKIVLDGSCMLNRNMTGGGCGETSCRTCGWNDVVHNARLMRIRNGEMEKRPNGTRGLVIRGFEEKFSPKGCDK